jgi:hypothetical protein
MKLSPRFEKLDTGLARSAAIATRTTGVSCSPVISGWMSLIQRPSVTVPSESPAGHDCHGAVQRRVEVGRGGPSWSGVRASQAGVWRNVPPGCSERRSSTARPWPTGTPSCSMVTSSTAMRLPARTDRVVTVTGASGTERNMSMVSRLQVISGASARACSAARAVSPPMSRPCKTWPHGLVANAAGTRVSPSARKNPSALDVDAALAWTAPSSAWSGGLTSPSGSALTICPSSRS